MPRSIFIQMLQKGEIIRVVSQTDEWFLVIIDMFVVDVYKRPVIIDHQAKVSLDSVGRLAAAPTIKEHRTFYLFGNDGVSKEAILVESMEKVHRLPE